MYDNALTGRLISWSVVAQMILNKYKIFKVPTQSCRGDNYLICGASPTLVLCEIHTGFRIYRTIAVIYTFCWAKVSRLRQLLEQNDCFAPRVESGNRSKRLFSIINLIEMKTKANFHVHKFKGQNVLCPRHTVESFFNSPTIICSEQADVLMFVA